MWLCILLCRRFGGIFENKQWRKVTQMQPMQLCILWGRRFENTFKTHSGENHTNAAAVTIHALRQEIWGHIWKHIAEKSSSNVISVLTNLLVKTFWGDIWKHTVEKGQTNSSSRIDKLMVHLKTQWKKVHIWLIKIFENSHSMKILPVEVKSWFYALFTLFNEFYLSCANLLYAYLIFVTGATAPV